MITAFSWKLQFCCIKWFERGYWWRFQVKLCTKSAFEVLLQALFCNKNKNPSYYDKNHFAQKIRSPVLHFLKNCKKKTFSKPVLVGETIDLSSIHESGELIDLFFSRNSIRTSSSNFTNRFYDKKAMKINDWIFWRCNIVTDIFSDTVTWIWSTTGHVRGLNHVVSNELTPICQKTSSIFWKWNFWSGSFLHIQRN